jgi:hypothetical protein
MLTIGWLAVALGVLAMHWADGDFPFRAAKSLRARTNRDGRHVYTAN